MKYNILSYINYTTDYLLSTIKTRLEELANALQSKIDTMKEEDKDK